MLKIGLTGGIGSGKSLVAKILEQLGVPVYYADAQASNLREKDPIVKKKILNLFGTTDRKQLAAIVFSDSTKLLQLNSILHPSVKFHFEKWLLQQQAPYVVKEAAVLFESGANLGLDEVVTVSAPEELRLDRVMKRDGLNREEVLKRIGNQMSEEERNKRSTYILQNDDSHMLLPQVLLLHKKWTGK